jgi:ubiquinone/menaquinone biosynthesis C-methylase UbiE
MERMTEIPKWQYDEMEHHGVDYADYSVVAKYDENHIRFRDYKKSAEEIISALGLGLEHTVIDMGCGTGAFVLHAAPRCKKVYAVDISATMLEYLKKKAAKDNLNNIEYHQAGFLTYEHTDELVDAVVSVAVLHHLPDFWKLVGLSRVADMVKPGGRMCLFDVVYPFNVREHKAAFDQWISSTEANLGKEFANETVIHIRDEYSTFDWILEGMLERSGFSINEQRTLEAVPGTTYICTRNRF